MKKQLYIEVMRIIAIALVIFNHLPGYVLYQYSGGVKQWLYMSVTMITRINVPLFFMISGALLLSKQEDFKTVILKRVSRIFLVIVIFEAALLVLYKLINQIYGIPYEISIQRYIYGVLARNLDGTGSYWYLYSYIGFLFMLPFMQSIAKNINTQGALCLVGLHFIFSTLIPILNIVLPFIGLNTLSISGDFSVPLANIKVYFYTLIGYYLDKYINIEQFKLKDIGGFISIAVVGIFISCICTYHEGITSGKFTQNYVQLTDYITTIVVFIIIKWMILEKGSNIINRVCAQIICFIGSLTFGIYLLDPFLKAAIYSKYESITEPYFPTIVVSFGWVIMSMAIGGFITLLLKKVPGMRRLI